MIRQMCSQKRNSCSSHLSFPISGLWSPPRFSLWSNGETTRQDVDCRWHSGSPLTAMLSSASCCYGYGCRTHTTLPIQALQPLAWRPISYITILLHHQSGGTGGWGVLARRSVRHGRSPSAAKLQPGLKRARASELACYCLSAATSVARASPNLQTDYSSSFDGVSQRCSIIFFFQHPPPLPASAFSFFQRVFFLS